RRGGLDLTTEVAQRVQCRGPDGLNLLISRAQGVGVRSQDKATFEGLNDRPDLPASPFATRIKAPGSHPPRTGPGSSGHEIVSFTDAVAQCSRPPHHARVYHTSKRGSSVATSLPVESQRGELTAEQSEIPEPEYPVSRARDERAAIGLKRQG